ncbi:MAG: hypothetical protein JO307_29265 [Bryobacterales bacterium]|nr:hypothetical protein [Bryobacterales bacterium]MBV9399383.1 hypothetical protein [Bryobacterales bacterium]
MKHLAIAITITLAGLPAFAGVISVDENGNGIGTASSGFLANDPGPGGLPNVLTYLLPFAGTQGDVLIGGPSDGGLIFDVVRFNGNGTLIFYSDNVPTADSLADTPGPPGFLYLNTAFASEVGPEGQNSAVYTPGPGQPGFDASLPSYTLVSDGTIGAAPEPGAWLLLTTVLGITALTMTHVRKRGALRR